MKSTIGVIRSAIGDLNGKRSGVGCQNYTDKVPSTLLPASQLSSRQSQAASCPEQPRWLALSASASIEARQEAKEPH